MFIQILILPLLVFFLIGLLGRYMGNKGVFMLVIIKHIISIMIVLSLFKTVILEGNIIRLELFNIINNDILNINWVIYFDEISVIMLVIILSISLIVLIYTYDYMIEDPHYIRFNLYIILFIFTMIILITSISLPILFIGWEGVGLSSFLLISFWFTRFDTTLGSLLALFMNRLGDIFYIIGIIMALLVFGSLDILTMISNPLFNSDIIIFFLFLAAITKSAQLSLHIWLPYSMEGPTPISALIHAATMVTAGVILLLRISILINYSYITIISITIIGALTALVGGTLALVSLDLKELIAYSTMSQLGYMITIMGIKYYNLSYFHLLFHAYFKALLFLTAGSIIHTIIDIQDFRITGGLINFLKVSYIILLIGLTSLTGLPFTTGFYSKELIITQSSQFYNIWGEFIYLITLLSALLTILYSFNFIIKLFIKTTRLSLFQFKFLHFFSLHLTLSLTILTFITLFVGFLFHKWNLLINLNSTKLNLFIPLSIKLLPLIFFIISIIILLYVKSSSNIRIKFLENGYGFKSLYLSISSVFLALSYRIFFKIFDSGYLDLLTSILGINLYNISKNITNFIDTPNNIPSSSKGINYISILLLSLFIFLNIL